MKIFHLLLFVATATLAQAQTVSLSIVNQNPDIADPWVTFIQSLNATSTWPTNGQSTTVLNGPALSATAGATTLQNGVSYQLSAIGTSITMGANWAGNIFFSDSNLSSVLGQSGQSPVQTANPTPPPAFSIPAFSQATFYPTNPNGAVTTDHGRYNYIELGGGSSSSINPDITYINYYSVPIQMTRASDGATRGAPASSAALAALPGNLSAISGNSPNVVVTSGGSTVRIISPDNGAAAYNNYPTFNNYITSAFAGGAKPIQLTNQYSGHGNEQGLIATQTYTGTSVTFDGSILTITGTSNNSDVGAYTLTWSGNATALSNAIYPAVLNGYNVTYATGTVTNGGTGDNNVFSAVTRDLLAGFSFGFINSANAGNLTSQQ